MNNIVAASRIVHSRFNPTDSRRTQVSLANLRRVIGDVTLCDLAKKTPRDDVHTQVASPSHINLSL